MSTTVNVLCYKSKVLANGESPLMLRICKDGKKKYKSIGVSINPIYWDYTKGKLKRNCPNYNSIHLLITEQLNEYSNQIVDFQVSKKDFTASSLVEKIDQQPDRKSIYATIYRKYILPCVECVKAEKFIDSKRVYVEMVNSMKEQYC